jgi:hypothetical protein
MPHMSFGDSLIDQGPCLIVQGLAMMVTSSEVEDSEKAHVPLRLSRCPGSSATTLFLLTARGPDAVDD